MSKPKDEVVLPNPVPWLLTVEQAAALLGLATSTVYELMRAKTLPRINISSGTERPTYRIPTRALDAWLAEQAGWHLTTFERAEAYEQLTKARKERAA